VSDGYRLRIVRTAGFEEEPGEELLSINLPGSFSPAAEDLYRSIAQQFLVDSKIYPWKVHDERNLVSIGASAEMRDVVIFLAGGAALTVTAELVKKIVDALQHLAERAVGRDDVGDVDALAIAILHHDTRASYGSLGEFARAANGNRLFRFADGSEVEVDKHGTIVRSTIDHSSKPV